MPKNPSNLKSQRVVGDSDEARIWIQDSDLSLHFKNILTTFTRRFSTLNFYRETDSLLNNIERSENIRFPVLLRKVREVLAFIEPNDAVLIQLDKFDGWTPRGEYLDEIWYRFDLIGYSSREQHDLLQKVELFPIGDWHRGGCSTLAVNLSPIGNLQVFEYCEEDLWDNLYDDISPFESTRAVYASYIDIFEHIIAIKLKDKRVIKAKSI
ncbi:MAG: hypothetical protein JXR84_25640 [Anaerolineae bacterium]|nr:hypothetical protein [Anaerolineae bacterium]